MVLDKKLKTSIPCVVIGLEHRSTSNSSTKRLYRFRIVLCGSTQPYDTCTKHRLAITESYLIRIHSAQLLLICVNANKTHKMSKHYKITNSECRWRGDEEVSTVRCDVTGVGTVIRSVYIAARKVSEQCSQNRANHNHIARYAVRVRRLCYIRENDNNNNNNNNPICKAP